MAAGALVFLLYADMWGCAFSALQWKRLYLTSARYLISQAQMLTPKEINSW